MSVEQMAVVATFATALATIVAVWLADRFRKGSELRAHRDEAQRLLRKYRDPLAQSAFDLQSRLYNIVTNDFLGKYLVRGTPTEQLYARESTVYIVAEYFGWVEHFRREVRFLDLGDVARNRRLVDLLTTISSVFLSERPDTTFRVFRAEQRALGAVIQGTGDDAGGCMSYAGFIERRGTPAFDRWFGSLLADVDRLAAEPGRHTERLVELQRALVELLAFLDPEFQYFPEWMRTPLPAPGAAPAAGTTAAAATGSAAATEAGGPALSAK